MPPSRSARRSSHTARRRRRAQWTHPNLGQRQPACSARIPACSARDASRVVCSTANVGQHSHPREAEGGAFPACNRPRLSPFALLLRAVWVSSYVTLVYHKGALHHTPKVASVERRTPATCVSARSCQRPSSHATKVIDACGSNHSRAPVKRPTYVAPATFGGTPTGQRQRSRATFVVASVAHGGSLASPAGQREQAAPQAKRAACQGKQAARQGDRAPRALVSLPPPYAAALPPRPLRAKRRRKFPREHSRSHAKPARKKTAPVFWARLWQARTSRDGLTLGNARRAYRGCGLHADVRSLSRIAASLRVVRLAHPCVRL